MEFHYVVLMNKLSSIVKFRLDSVNAFSKYKKQSLPFFKHWNSVNPTQVLSEEVLDVI